MGALASRLFFAVRCSAVAALFCLFLGVEAVAHERFFTKAIDGLPGHESYWMKINIQYLQNTLEQIVLFALGLIALAGQVQDGSGMRAVVAATLVWVVSRFVFWVGFHWAPWMRAPGLVGMVQSLFVLLYVSGCFLNEYLGTVAVIFAALLFVGVEILLVRRGKAQGDRSLL
jgi:hypothetical protein